MSLQNRSMLLRRRKSCKAKFASPWMFTSKSLLMTVVRNKKRGPKYRNSSNRKMFKAYSIDLMQV